MGSARTIFRNFLSLTFSNAVSKAFGLMTVVYLARVLGPEDFGAMNFALALVSYFAILAHLNLGTVGIRELAQHTGEKGAYINANISAKILLGLVSMALLAVFAFFMPQGRDLKLLTVSYGLTMFTANVLTFDWVFQGVERMEFLGAGSVLQGLVYLGAVLLFVGGSADLPRIPFLLLAAQAASVVFMFLAYRRLDPGYAFRFAPGQARELFRQGLPIAVWGVMTIIILNSGVTILGFARGTEEVGYFSAAYKIIWIIVETMVAYAAAVFPSISRHYLQSPDTFKKIMDATLKWMGIVSYPAIAGLFVLSGPVIHLIYGDKFSNAALLLRILSALPFFIFLNNIFFYSLLAAHRQDKNLRISFFQAGLSVALGLLLIPPYGAVGLAASFVLSYGVTNAVYYFQSRGIYTAPLRQSVRPAAAALLMALLLAVLPPLNVFLLIGIGAAAYAALLLLLGGVRKEDLDLLARTAGFGGEGGGA